MYLTIGAFGASLSGASMLGIAFFQWLNAACKNFCSIGFVNTLLAVLYVDLYNSALIFVSLLSFSCDDVEVSVVSLHGGVILVDGFLNFLSNCFSI